MTWFVDAYDLLAKGGPVMVPLVLCSVISLAVIAERFIRLWEARASVSGLAEEVVALLRTGKPSEAVHLCESRPGPGPAILLAGLDHRKDDPVASERAMTEAAARELPGLRVRLHFLDTIVTIAPLLGLLGTVTGMIRSFHVISTREGISTPMAITGGVAEALIATATGLGIAIFTLVGYNYLNEQVGRVISAIEESSNHLLRILAELKEERNEVPAISA